MANQNVKNFCLIPKVRELRLTDGRLEASAIGRINAAPATDNDVVNAAEYLREKIFETTGAGLELSYGIDTGAVGTVICVDMGIDTVDNIGINNNERYRLTVTPEGVRIRAASAKGLFPAAATLTQLIINNPKSVPCVDIVDWPDFPVRGFYHDVTRGRVPTMRSLKRLVDTLAFYKLNQLQLYVEHTFAFSMIPEFSHGGKTPLTAADIRELDRYCVGRGVELVPSLSTFGHLYELLRLPQYERLNELDITASATPRDLWDRMAHYTLNVSAPQSFELVKSMIEEYAPLFSSGWFNICCDETFDLGKGKNAERAQNEGVGRLYVEFVNKIIGVVKSVGKKPMLWGDIVLKHPEYISELPADTVFLNWDYVPDVGDESVKKFQAAGVPQYVCPGVQGWSRFAADVDRACANISRLVRFGREAGAVGVLNTNWGDCAHINLPATAYHGLAFGAEHSWYCGDTDDFDRRFSLLQWGVDTPLLGKLLRELGGLSAYHFGNLYAWAVDKRCLWYKEDDVKAADTQDLLNKANRAAEIKKELETIAAYSPVINAKSELTAQSGTVTQDDIYNEFKEYIWSAEATAWLLSLLIAKKKYEYKQEVETLPADPPRLIDMGKTLLEQFKTLWRSSGRESELQDVVDTFEAVFRRVNTFS